MISHQTPRSDALGIYKHQYGKGVANKRASHDGVYWDFPIQVEFEAQMV